MRPALCLAALVPIALAAHPMGNFSVNHYSKLVFNAKGVEITYVLDLAEIPAFQLLSDWQTDGKDQAALSRRARLQAREWLDHVALSENGKRVPLKIKSVSATAPEGAGGMAILRVVTIADAAAVPGDVRYEDGNFAGRAGWKEIVVDHDASARLDNAGANTKDISKALTVYPADPTVAPPQATSVAVKWSAVVAPAKPRPIVQPAPVTSLQQPPATFSQQQPAAPGAVVKGDYLSRLLQRKDLTWSLAWFGVAAAFGLGAMHAMSPGHGKTIVAAYLVGSRGTLKHAALLGGVVTFTHTISVFLLGVGVLFFQQYISPEKVVPVLGTLSGLSIVGVGAMLLYQRAHSHAADFAVARPAPSRISQLRGDAVPAPEVATETKRELSSASLVALGISGGLVPCPSALILMLSAIALGHPGIGLFLLVGFSAGLAIVLMVFGTVAVYARHLLPNSGRASDSRLFRLLPVASAVVVICLGLAMTAVSAGWLRPMRFLS